MQQLGRGFGIARRVFGDGGVAGQLGGVLARGVGGQADVVAANVLRGAVAVEDNACGRRDGDVTGGAGIEHADGDVRLRLQGDVAAIGLQVAGDDHAVVARHRRAGLGHRGQGDAAATWQVDGVVLVEEDDVARGRRQGQGAAIHGDGAAAVVQHGDRGRDDGDRGGAFAGQRAAVDRYGAGVGGGHATAAACCGEEADVEVQVALLADAARGAHVQLAGDHVGLGLVGAAIFDGAAGAQLDVVAAGVDVTQLDAAVGGDLDVAAGAAAGGLHQGQQVAVALAGVDTAVGSVDHQFVDLDFQGVAAGTEGLHRCGQAAGDEVGGRAVAIGDVAGHLEVDGTAGLDLAYDHVTGVLEGDLAVGGQDVQQADGADVGVVDVAAGSGQVDRASHLAGQCLGAGTDGGGVDGQGAGRDRRAHGGGVGGHGATGGQGDGGLGDDRVDGQVAALVDGDGTVGGAGLGGQGQVAGGVGDVGDAVAAGQVQAGGLGLQRGVGGADVAGGVDDHVLTDDGTAALGDVAGGGQRDALVGAGVDAVHLEAAGGVGERQVQGLGAVQGQGVEVAAVDQRATGEGDVGVAVRGGHRQAAQCLAVGHVHAGLGRGGGGGDGVDVGGQRFVGGAGGGFARRGQAAGGDVGAGAGGGDAAIAGSQGDVAAGGGDAANGDAALGGVEHNVVVGTGGGQGADGQAVAFAQVHAAVAGAGVDGIALGAQGQGFVTDFLACAQVDGATDQRGAGLGGQDAAGVGGDVQAVGGRHGAGQDHAFAGADLDVLGAGAAVAQGDGARVVDGGRAGGQVVDGDLLAGDHVAEDQRTFVLDVDAAVLGRGGQYADLGVDRGVVGAHGSVGNELGRVAGDVGLAGVGGGDVAVLGGDDHAAAGGIGARLDFTQGHAAVDVGDQNVAAGRSSVEHVGVDGQGCAFGTDRGVLVSDFQVQGGGAGRAVGTGGDAVAGLQGRGGGRRGADAFDGVVLDDVAGLDVEVGGFDDAGVVDHRAHQAAGGVALQQDGLGRNGTAVGHAVQVVAGRGGQGVGRHAEVDQVAALQVDGEAVTGSHGHATDVGDHEAGVVDLRRHQVDEATGVGSDLTLVGDAAQVLAGDLGEVQLAAVEEALVVDVEGGGQQAGHVDLGTGAEDDAVGVDQEDVAVGLQGALDVGDLVAQNPVQGDRVITGVLGEAHQLASVDAEVGPVDDAFLQRLGDHQFVVVHGADGDATGHGDAASGCGQCDRAAGADHGNRDRLDESLCAFLLAGHEYLPVRIGCGFRGSEAIARLGVDVGAVLGLLTEGYTDVQAQVDAVDRTGQQADGGAGQVLMVVLADQGVLQPDLAVIDARGRLVAVAVLEQRVAAFEAGGETVVTRPGRRRMADYRVETTDAPLFAGHQRVEGVLAGDARDHQEARGDLLQAGNVEGELGELVVCLGGSAAGHQRLVVHAAQGFAQAVVQTGGGQGAAVQVGVVQVQAEAQFADLVFGGAHAEDALLQILGFEPGFGGDDAACRTHEVLGNAQAPALVVTFDLQYAVGVADVDVTFGEVGAGLGALGIERQAVVDVAVPQVAVADGGQRHDVGFVAVAGQVGELQARDYAGFAGVLAAVVVDFQSALNAGFLGDVDHQVGGTGFHARLQGRADLDAGQAVEVGQRALDLLQGEWLASDHAASGQGVKHLLGGETLGTGDLHVAQPAFQNHQFEGVLVSEVLCGHHHLDQAVAGGLVVGLDLGGQGFHVGQAHWATQIVCDLCRELFAGEGAVTAELDGLDHHLGLRRLGLRGLSCGFVGHCCVGCHHGKTEGAQQRLRRYVGIGHGNLAVSDWRGSC